LRTRQPSEAHGQIDERRRTVAVDLQCSRGMHGVYTGTLRLVARPLPVRGCHFHRIRGKTISLAAAGSGWPTRRRNHFKPLCTGHRPYRGTLKPSARLDRTNWHHGLPDGKPWMGRCRALQSEPANLSTKRGHGQIWADNLETHLGGPGEPSGATRRPRGRPWRPPECPDGHGRLRRQSPAWVKG
jgi:hypothetical protein